MRSAKTIKVLSLLKNLRYVVCLDPGIPGDGQAIDLSIISCKSGGKDPSLSIAYAMKIDADESFRTTSGALFLGPENEQLT